MRVTVLFSLLITLSNTAVKAQYWDVNKIVKDYQWTFRMSQGADSLGYSKIEIKKIGDQLLISEDVAVPGLTEDLFIYANPSTLKPDSALIVGRLSGFPVECKVTMSGNRVSGYSNFPKHPTRPTINISTELPEGFIFRAQSFFMSPFFKDLNEGYTFTYSQFNAMDGQVREITAVVVGSEQVLLKDKTYEAYRLELSGGVAQQNIFIDKAEPRILKMSFRDTPWIYELIEAQSN